MKLTKREKKAIESCYLTLYLLDSNNKIPKKIKLDNIIFELDYNKFKADLIVLMNLILRIKKYETEKRNNIYLKEED